MASHLVYAIFFATLVGYAVSSLPPCGPTGRQCIQDRSICFNNTCTCINPPFVWGDGFFNCYRRNTVAAESRNDPSFTTFNNETAEFPFPCRYLVTHLTQELRDRSKNQLGICEVKISAFNQRNKGKIFSEGIDIAVDIRYDNGTVVSRSVRKYGTQENDVMQVNVEGALAYNPDGPFTPGVNVNFQDGDINLECSENEPNNQFEFKLFACGVHVTFVPYDTVLGRDQPQIPGTSFGVNCAYQPTWLSNDDVIGLAPYWQGGLTFSDILRPGLSRSQSLVDRAFRTPVVQNQPGGNSECANAGPILDACSDSQRADAYENCFWMLTQARFIRCVSATSNHLAIFLRCVEAWCGNPSACAVAISEIGSCASTGGISELSEFVAGTRCP